MKNLKYITSWRPKLDFIDGNLCIPICDKIVREFNLEIGEEYSACAGTDEGGQLVIEIYFS